MSEDESTTPDLVERTRRFLEAVNSGENDLWASSIAQDAVWDATGLDLLVCEGREAIREFLIVEWQGFFDEANTTAEEIVDFGHSIIFGVGQSGRDFAQQSGDRFVPERSAQRSAECQGVVGPNPVAPLQVQVDASVGRHACSRSWLEAAASR